MDEMFMARKLDEDYMRLGLQKGTKLSIDEIKKAYKRRALKLHPDKRPGCDRSAATAEFQKLLSSYQKLLSAAAYSQEVQIDQNSNRKDHRGRSEHDRDDRYRYHADGGGKYNSTRNTHCDRDEHGGDFNYDIWKDYIHNIWKSILDIWKDISRNTHTGSGKFNSSRNTPRDGGKFNSSRNTHRDGGKFNSSRNTHTSRNTHCDPRDDGGKFNSSSSRNTHTSRNTHCDPRDDGGKFNSSRNTHRSRDTHCDPRDDDRKFNSSRNTHRNRRDEDSQGVIGLIILVTVMMVGAGLISIIKTKN